MNRQKTKPNYGIDAPKILRLYVLIALALICATFLVFYFLYSKLPALTWFIVGFLVITICFVLYPVIMIINGSYRLKFRERDWLFGLLDIKGNERILDIGCGRGLLLIGAAKKLKTGKAIGIDIWSSDDQIANSKEATLQNALLEGVSDKIEVVTADARQMPFDSSSFDLVISSWALHNISGQKERQRALSEIVRVLKPGGTVAIMDIDTFDEYESFFKKNRFKDIEVIGPRYTFGNPTYIVKASK